MSLSSALPSAVNKPTLHVSYYSESLTFLVKVDSIFPQLFRDCLRLASHIGGQSAKGIGLRTMIRSEFRKNTAVSDPAAIETLRAAAVIWVSCLACRF